MPLSITASWLALALLWIGAPAVAVAQQPVDESRLRDARELARMKAIPVAEALRRLQLQQDVRHFSNSIRDIPGYSITIIDSGAKHYRVIVVASAAAIPRIAASPLLRGTPLGAVTRFETARADRATLEDLQGELVARLSGQAKLTKQPFSVTIDHRAGQVVVAAPDPAALARTIDTRRYGKLVRFRKETLFPRPVPGPPAT